MPLWKRLAQLFGRREQAGRETAERILLEADFGMAATEEVLDRAAHATDGDFHRALERAVRVPIRFLGTGEGLDDLEAFDAERFAQRLVSG